jgi:hypothetical protein
MEHIESNEPIKSRPSAEVKILHDEHAKSTFTQWLQPCETDRNWV